MKRPPRDWPRRRALRMVGGVGSIAAAGCLTSLSRTDSCSDGADFSVDEAADAHVSNEFSTSLDGLAYAARTVVTDALDTDTGESTSRGYYSPHLRTAYVVTGPEAHYYRVETTDRDRAETTGYEYSVEIDVDESALSDDDQVRSFTDLPTHDRESLRSAIGNPGLLHAPHYTSFSVVFAYEHSDVRDQSEFVPGVHSHYLEWDETLLRLTFEERRTVEITSTTVSTELVAESQGEFVEYVGGERGVVLDSLTSQQRDIVARAIDGTYTECEPYSEPFSELRERLSTREDGFAPLVYYDGNWYFAHLS
ncbi:hypothetical protein [Halomontanus rarus]|uniref:hypothetical protein n=1 Tax=Halomontanus rarus TaxID=3034020 RepID=UPI001A99B716